MNRDKIGTQTCYVHQHTLLVKVQSVTSALAWLYRGRRACRFSSRQYISLPWYVHIRRGRVSTLYAWCSYGESSSTHLSFAYVVLSASCYTNRQHISHISLLSASSLCASVATR